MSDQKKIIDFALEELKKTMEKIKAGQKPPSPRKLKKLIKNITEANKIMKEEEFNSYINDIAKKVD